MTTYIQFKDGSLLKCNNLGQAREIAAKSDLKVIQIPSRSITPNKRQKILERQNYTCSVCFEAINEGDCDIDHIWPYSLALNYKNGPENINEDSNLRALHKHCNRVKRDSWQDGMNQLGRSQ